VLERIIDLICFCMDGFAVAVLGFRHVQSQAVFSSVMAEVAPNGFVLNPHCNELSIN